MILTQTNHKLARAVALILLLAMTATICSSFTAFASGGTVDDLFQTGSGKDGESMLTVNAGDYDQSAKTALGNGKRIVRIILAGASMVCLAFLIVNITKFAKSGDNEQDRKRALIGILTTGIGIALLGSITIWYSFFYKTFTG